MGRGLSTRSPKLKRTSGGHEALTVDDQRERRPRQRLRRRRRRRRGARSRLSLAVPGEEAADGRGGADGAGDGRGLVAAAGAVEEVEVAAVDAADAGAALGRRRQHAGALAAVVVDDEDVDL